MKLSLIYEDTSLTLYKGISEHGGLKNWPTNDIGSKGAHIPGFLSNWHIARVYSEPKLTGPVNSAGMIAEFKINQHSIEDRTVEFVKWCDKNNNPRHDISMSYPKEWRSDKSIWTVSQSGSAHINHSCFGNASFVYCGVSLPYIVAAFYNNQEEWKIGGR